MADPSHSPTRHTHSRQSSASSYINVGRRGSTKDPEALQAAIARSRKRRTNSTASARITDDDDLELEDSASVRRQRQEDVRLLRCDAEQQRRNELGRGYDRLRAALNRGDERLSKARVVERATARVVQLRDQNARMEEELTRKQEIIRDLNRANEQLMLDASGAVLVSSPSSSSGRPGSSSHTSVSAFGVGPPTRSHDRSSSLPTPPHTFTGLQHPNPTGEFGLAPSLYAKQEPFVFDTFDGPASFDQDPQLFSGGAAEFYAAPLEPPPAIALQPRSESPRSYEHSQAFGLPPGASGDDHWLPDRPPHWSTNSGLPSSFPTAHNFTSSSREALVELSEVPASGYPPW